MQHYLEATEAFDYHHPLVKEVLQRVDRPSESLKERMVRLYLYVRDQIRYDPYTYRKAKASFAASTVLQQGASYCIPKAVLLGALARAIGVPSRIGLADVRNHLADPQFVEKLGSDIFAMHGYCELYLQERWVKATPAFNAALCSKFGVLPLEFNGEEDSLFQEFLPGQQRYMEYLRDYGNFADVPYDFIEKQLCLAYPKLQELIVKGSWLSKE